ncbi:MAG TPA: hypothetical protein VMZ28_18180, partial [Kofleriaceae bacterium]|nr:hypothetical protein [Kofleriaceae bacterium]
RVLLGSRTLRAVPGERSWAEALRTFRFGFQVWIGSTLSNVAATMDLVLLGWILGDGSRLLGYYAVGLMVTQVLAQNLSAVTMVQQRALRRQIGEAGGVGAEEVALETRRLLGTDAFVGVVFAAATISGAYLVFPPLLPKFVAALPGLGALLTSILLIKARVYTRVILTTADRPRLAMIAPLVQLGAMAAIYPLVVSGESSVLVLGLLRMGAFLASSMLEVVLAYAVMGRTRLGLQLAAQLILGLAPTAVGFIWVPDLLDHAAASCVGPILAVAASYVVYNLLFDGSAREGVRMLRQVLRRVARRRESPAPPR